VSNVVAHRKTPRSQCSTSHWTPNPLPHFEQRSACALLLAMRLLPFAWRILQWTPLMNLCWQSARP